MSIQTPTRRAFTIIELLVVVAIVAVLVAIMYPVMARAIHSAQINSSQSRLKQLHVAIELYRMDHDGTGNYGDPQQAGFPGYGYVYGTFLGFEQDFFRSPCGYKESIEPNRWRLSYQYSVSMDDVFVQHFRKHGENATLFVDQHCNVDGVDLASQYVPKRGLGVTIGGQLLNHYKAGDTGNPEWWLP